jgi:hypothetical protein
MEGWRFFCESNHQRRTSYVFAGIAKIPLLYRTRTVSKSNRICETNEQISGTRSVVTLCVWLSHNLASTSLTKLSSEVEAATGISIAQKD